MEVDCTVVCNCDVFVRTRRACAGAAARSGHHLFHADLLVLGNPPGPPGAPCGCLSPNGYVPGELGESRVKVISAGVPGSFSNFLGRASTRIAVSYGQHISFGFWTALKASISGTCDR
jgi:hypothetical protein